MDSFEYELLCHLRRGNMSTLACDEQPTWQQKKIGRTASARQFYVGSFEDNLVEEMGASARRAFDEGAGKELNGKMCALRSSSALTFNLFGNGEVAIADSSRREAPIPSGNYRVQYEYKAPTLEGSGNPAHLDALLGSQDGLTFIACEMKLMEWLTGTPSSLGGKYLDSGAYRSKGRIFSETARRLDAMQFSRYDFAQMFKHTVGLYNKLEEGAFDLGEQLVLLNCVWDPRECEEVSWTSGTAERLEGAWAQEHGEFERFRNAMEGAIELFSRAEKPVDFSIRLCSHVELIDAIDWAKRRDVRELLGKRYGARSEADEV